VLAGKFGRTRLIQVTNDLHDNFFKKNGVLGVLGVLYVLSRRPFRRDCVGYKGRVTYRPRF
jgi:hypothetical protein